MDGLSASGLWGFSELKVRLGSVEVLAEAPKDSAQAVATLIFSDVAPGNYPRGNRTAQPPSPTFWSSLTPRNERKLVMPAYGFAHLRSRRNHSDVIEYLERIQATSTPSLTASSSTVRRSTS